MTNVCPICNNEIREGVSVCPSCGYRMIGSTMSFTPVAVENCGKLLIRFKDNHSRKNDNRNEKRKYSNENISFFHLITPQVPIKRLLYVQDLLYHRRRFRECPIPFCRL